MKRVTSPEERRMIWKMHQEGYNNREISKRLHPPITASGVYQIIRRIKKRGEAAFVTPARSWKLKRHYTEADRVLFIKLHQTGHTVSEIAQRIGCSRGIIYHWIKQYIKMDQSTFISPPPPDRSRAGRKRKYPAHKVLDLLDHSPREYGYNQDGWTCQLLAEVLSQKGAKVSWGWVNNILVCNGAFKTWVRKKKGKPNG